MRTMKTARTGPTPRLIGVFAGRKGDFVGIVMLYLKVLPTDAQIVMMLMQMY